MTRASLTTVGVAGGVGSGDAIGTLLHSAADRARGHGFLRCSTPSATMTDVSMTLPLPDGSAKSVGGHAGVGLAQAASASARICLRMQQRSDRVSGVHAAGYPHGSQRFTGLR